MFYATDAVSLGDVRVSDGGYLEAFARTVRTGCQTYLGSEVGKPELSTVTVYRDEREVFSKDSLESFRLIPVTIDHPPGGVSAKNWRNVARGTTGAEVLRDGEYLRLGLRVKDEAAVAEVRSGKCQLSAGYRCKLQWGDGIAPDGTPYQAKQVGIVADHIAIVSAGRAGPQCRIGDSWSAFDDGGKRDPDRDTPRPTADRDTPLMHKLTIDGITVDLSDTAREVVSKALADKATLVADNLKLTADLATAGSAKDEAVRAKDGEILKLQADHAVALEAKDKQIADLQAQTITADKLDAAVAERSAVMDAAKPWLGADFDPKGKTVADIRKATVAKRLGDKAVEGKDDSHIAVAFDTLTALAPQKDALGQAIGDSLPNARPQGDNVVQIGDAATEYARMQERDRNAWKMGA